MEPEALTVGLGQRASPAAFARCFHAISAYPATAEPTPDADDRDLRDLEARSGDEGG